MKEPYLYTPGPTPLPDEVRQRLARPIIHHRSPEFATVLRRVHKNLQQIFETRQPVLVLTCSGSGAGEAGIVNLFSPGDTCLYTGGGKFAARWGQIMRAYGIRAVEIAVQPGRAPRVEDLAESLRQHPEAASVWLVHSETSTGVLADIQSLSEYIHAHSNALVCVDGVSSLCAHPCPMDSWGIDLLFAGSQKGFMAPPGLAFIALSDRAWQRAESASLPKFYFDLHAAREAWLSGTTPWTPAITTVCALDTALTMLLEEGLAAVHRRHARHSAALRAGLLALGLETFGAPPSHALTAVRLPSAGECFLRELRDRHQIVTAGGQGELKDVLFRIGHLGWYNEKDMLRVIKAIECSLIACGLPLRSGSGDQAMQKVYDAMVP